MQKTGSEK